MEMLWVLSWIALQVRPLLPGIPFILPLIQMTFLEMFLLIGTVRMQPVPILKLKQTVGILSNSR